MKPNPFENSYRHTTPMRGVRTTNITNKAKVTKTSGKIGLNCDLCGLVFETYACWAKRHAHHFCSRACAHAFKEININNSCKECGKPIIVTPTEYARIVTCSKECSDIHKGKHLKNIKGKALQGRLNSRNETRKLITAKILMLNKEGMSQTAISKILGCTQANVMHYLKKSGENYLRQVPRFSQLKKE